MKISPDLIPHDLFHTGTWLQSEENPSWYYFRKSKNPNIITNEGFNDTLDEPLKELVLFLHNKGIKTTPSCSGHHKHIQDFEKIFRDLEMDRKQIRNGGLNMKDVETGLTFLYRDKKYELPWNKKEFCEKILVYQHNGVLGLRLENRKKVKDQLMNLDVKGIKIVQKDPVLLILTNSENKSGITETWKEITSRVKAIIKVA